MARRTSGILGILALASILLAIPGVASAQLGVLHGNFGFDGTPEFACVGERVTSIIRAVNHSDDPWSVVDASVVVHHPSGVEASGNLFPTPAPLPPMGASVDGAFLWTVRPEDLPMVFTRGTISVEVFPGGIGGGSFGAQVFVFQCDEPTLQARRQAASINRYRAACEDYDEPFRMRVCRTASETFTAPLR